MVRIGGIKVIIGLLMQSLPINGANRDGNGY